MRKINILILVIIFCLAFQSSGFASAQLAPMGLNESKKNKRVRLALGDHYFEPYTGKVVVEAGDYFTCEIRYKDNKVYCEYYAFDPQPYNEKYHISRSYELNETVVVGRSHFEDIRDRTTSRQHFSFTMHIINRTPYLRVEQLGNTNNTILEITDQNEDSGFLDDMSNYSIVEHRLGAKADKFPRANQKYRDKYTGKVLVTAGMSNFEIWFEDGKVKLRYEKHDNNNKICRITRIYKLGETINTNKEHYGISDKWLSRTHFNFAIEMVDGQLYLEINDLGSRNGTVVGVFTEKINYRFAIDPIRELTPDELYLSEGNLWRVHYPKDNILPQQGIEIHIAATEQNVKGILRLLLDRLRECRLKHRVVDSMKSLKEIYKYREYAGKAITIYTTSEADARFTAMEFDDTLAEYGFTPPANLPWTVDGRGGTKYMPNSKSGIIGYSYYGDENGNIRLPNGTVVKNDPDRYKPEGITDTLTIRPTTSWSCGLPTNDASASSL